MVSSSMLSAPRVISRLFNSADVGCWSRAFCCCRPESKTAPGHTMKDRSTPTAALGDHPLLPPVLECMGSRRESVKHRRRGQTDRKQRFWCHSSCWDGQAKQHEHMPQVLAPRHHQEVDFQTRRLASQGGGAMMMRHLCTGRQGHTQTNRAPSWFSYRHTVDVGTHVARSDLWAVLSDACRTVSSR